MSQNIGIRNWRETLWRPKRPGNEEEDWIYKKKKGSVEVGPVLSFKKKLTLGKLEDLNMYRYMYFKSSWKVPHKPGIPYGA